MGRNINGFMRNRIDLLTNMIGMINIKNTAINIRDSIKKKIRKCSIVVIIMRMIMIQIGKLIELRNIGKRD